MSLALVVFLWFFCGFLVSLVVFYGFLDFPLGFSRAFLWVFPRPVFKALMSL